MAHDDIRARLALLGGQIDHKFKPMEEDVWPRFCTDCGNSEHVHMYREHVFTLLRANEALETEREAISALFPDDATHKHEQTGESLYDNIQDVLRLKQKFEGALMTANANTRRAHVRNEALEKALRGQQCKCPVLLECPHCGGCVVEGVDQFSGSWICGVCVKTVDLPKDPARQCVRCAALAGAETGAEGGHE